MPTLTASARSAIQTGAGAHVAENFVPLLRAGIDEVFQRVLETPREGDAFFEKRSTTKIREYFQPVVGIGNISRSRDADYIPHDEKSLGFDHSITNYIYRGRVGHEKSLLETEQYGQIGDNQEELAQAAVRTMELVMADVFNRGLGASGAPFLCEDGMYLIDSARPNPHPAAGTWSNLESTGAISAAGIYQAQLNAAAYRNERGHLHPLKVEMLVIRPQDEEDVWEIVNSDKRPSDAMNAKNFQFGRFQYRVYNYLTTPSVFYKLSGIKNELYFQERVSPEFTTWQGADNPDMYWQRVRFAMGVGALRPACWRGALTE